MNGGWGPDEKVDGAGLTVYQHVLAVANELALSKDQTSVLVAEVRNALVPAYCATSEPVTRKCIFRVLALMDELALRAR